jgi:SAM-dependent methyltransferase
MTTPAVPVSRLCTQKDLESPSFQRLGDVLREPHLWMHRKLWEWCFIAEVLHNEGLLSSGHRGLGFAVGHEPLVAYFASQGATILASDLDLARAADAGWVESNEHAASLAKLNDRGLCDDEQFARLVDFRSLDMTDFDTTELNDFDFVWSSCAFEHLGSLAAGHRFVMEAMDCLKPGGLAVHTTEFNVGSNDATVSEGATVIYRQRDIEELVDDLRSRGHSVVADFDRGHQLADYHVDVPPYTHDPHLKLHLMGFTTTSVGIVVRHG